MYKNGFSTFGVVCKKEIALSNLKCQETFIVIIYMSGITII